MLTSQKTWHKTGVKHPFTNHRVRQINIQRFYKALGGKKVQLFKHCLKGAKPVRSCKAPAALTVPDQRGEGQEHAEGQGHEAHTGRRGGRAARHQLQELLSFLIRGPGQDTEQNKAGH